MKVVWVSLIKFPPLCTHLGEAIPAHCGWLYSSAKALLDRVPDLRLGVIIYSYGNKFEEHEVDGITYYLVPSKHMSKINKDQVINCKEVLQRFQPDLIHIHGTEYSLAQAVCMANGHEVKIVASIQGLANPYTRYADGGLSLTEKCRNITPLDFYRGTYLLNAKRSFKQRAAVENYVITHVTNIIGRTQWDCDHVMTINPKLHYHSMNETLRDSFYQEPIWNLDNCKKHTIFVSNSGTPLKGAHQVLKALTIVIKSYPNTVVNFCGSSVMNSNFKTMLRFQGYHLYLRRLVKKLGLQKNVNFLGTLTETQMKKAFLDAHVYVMPSAIENSPNSLCEAQILGVPVVTSYCGGTPTLVEEGKTGHMYRYEEIEMLAQIIMRLFQQKDFTQLSSNEKEVALNRHDREINARRLAEIYTQITNRSQNT